MPILRRTLLLISLVAALCGAAFSARVAHGQAAPPVPTPTASSQNPVPLPADTGTHAVAFTLDAARVSQVNNPGNKRGLASVRPGTTVWLMMYYTIDSVSKASKRVAAYRVVQNGKVIFSRTFTESVAPKDSGQSVRYMPYTVSASAPHGRYTFEATLTIAGQQQTQWWGFQVANQTRTAASATSTNPATNPADQPSFLLYAARVAPAGNPGNMLGLPAAPLGKTVWLMMYYTMTRVPQSVSWVATYTVTHAGKLMGQFKYHGQMSAGTTGSFVRYAPFALAPSFAPGRYSFRASLSVGGRVETRTWGFNVTAPLLARRDSRP